jgi:beta-glucosidase
MNTFPPGFVFGSATSSYQIEGAVNVDGRGESIWDRFSHTPGKVKGGHTGDIACDHYHRFAEDIALLKQLNVEAYRLSIAWPRILPTGREATPNAKGLVFYDRIVDALLEAGITPWVTLYHWDLPQALEDAGGWPSRGIIDPFVHFADVMSRHLGDRVKHWITHNEPWVVATLGYWNGEHAPGIKDPNAALKAAHHIMLSHGKAVPVIRANSAGSQVGITVNLTPGIPASPSEADRIACQQFDGFFNRWYLDPLHKRGYPADQVAHYESEGHLPNGMDFVEDGDLETIAVETDFLGINYYSRAIIRSETVAEADNAPRTQAEPPPERCTDFGWEVWPDGLYDILARLHHDYDAGDLVVTENGCAYSTEPDGEGRVKDARRVSYFDSHLRACLRCVNDGIPLTGYFAWSLLDNFEWAEGYEKRFGLTWVDFETGERVPKDSFRFFAEVAKNRARPTW